MMEKEETAAGLLETWKRTHRASITGTGICKECGWTGLMAGFNECLRCHKRWMLEPMTDETNPASVAARRLDGMAEAAGIWLVGGVFSYDNMAIGGEPHIEGIPGGGIKQVRGWMDMRMSASEQQAIQEWLLIKEQLKNKEGGANG